MTPRTNKERGTVVVETALASTVFFMLVVGILDFGRMQYYRSNLQHAVSQSTRFATLGSTLEDPNSPGNQLSREESIRYMIRKLANVPDLDPSDIKIGAIDSSGALVEGAGGPGDVVTVQATYRVVLVAPYLNLAFPKGQYRFTCTTSFRNEAFGAVSGLAIERRTAVSA